MAHTHCTFDVDLGAYGILLDTANRNWHLGISAMQDPTYEQVRCSAFHLFRRFSPTRQQLMHTIYYCYDRKKRLMSNLGMCPQPHRSQVQQHAHISKVEFF